MKTTHNKIGFGLSLAITAVISSVFVVLKEINAPLKTWMKDLTGHHWVTHGILILAFFAGLGFLLSRYKLSDSMNLILSKIIIGGTLLSSVIIIGFYLLH